MWLYEHRVKALEQISELERCSTDLTNNKLAVVMLLLPAASDLLMFPTEISRKPAVSDGVES